MPFIIAQKRKGYISKKLIYFVYRSEVLLTNYSNTRMNFLNYLFCIFVYDQEHER